MSVGISAPETLTRSERIAQTMARITELSRRDPNLLYSIAAVALAYAPDALEAALDQTEADLALEA